MVTKVESPPRTPLDFCDNCGHGMDAHRTHRRVPAPLGCAGFTGNRGKERCGCAVLLVYGLRNTCLYCDNKPHARDRCRTHYARDWRAGLFTGEPKLKFTRAKQFADYWDKCPCGSTKRMRRGLCVNCMRRWQRAQQGIVPRGPIYEPQPKKRKREYPTNKAYGYAKAGE